MAINKVLLTGNLTRDAEIRATRNEHKPVLTFTLAVDDRRKNQQTGEWEEVPNFVGCALYGPRADALHRRLTKGLKVAVEGRLRYNSYVKDDEKRTYLDVVVSEVEFISPRADATAPQSAHDAPAAHMAPAADPMAPTPVQPPAPELYDEDVPF